MSTAFITIKINCVCYVLDHISCPADICLNLSKLRLNNQKSEAKTESTYLEFIPYVWSKKARQWVIQFWFVCRRKIYAWNPSLTFLTFSNLPQEPGSLVSHVFRTLLWTSQSVHLLLGHETSEQGCLKHRACECYWWHSRRGPDLRLEPLGWMEWGIF